MSVTALHSARVPNKSTGKGSSTANKLHIHFAAVDDELNQIGMLSSPVVSWTKHSSLALRPATTSLAPAERTITVASKKLDQSPAVTWTSAQRKLLAVLEGEVTRVQTLRISLRTRTSATTAQLQMINSIKGRLDFLISEADTNDVRMPEGLAQDTYTLETGLLGSITVCTKDIADAVNNLIETLKGSA